MNTMQDNDITPRNKQGERHGYWEKYRTNKTLWYKSNYINGVWYGYFEHHRFPRIAKEYAAR
jgi:hypothetical protein